MTKKRETKKAAPNGYITIEGARPIYHFWQIGHAPGPYTFLRPEYTRVGLRVFILESRYRSLVIHSHRDIPSEQPRWIPAYVTKIWSGDKDPVITVTFDNQNLQGEGLDISGGLDRISNFCLVLIKDVRKRQECSSP
jgi:hypothetical protein